MVHTLLSF